MSLFYFAIVLYWPMVGSGSRSWTKFLRILLLHTLLSSLAGPVTRQAARLATYLSARLLTGRPASSTRYFTTFLQGSAPQLTAQAALSNFTI